MKITIAICLIAILTLHAPAQTNRLSLTNDLTTLTGTTYKNFRIEKAEPNGLVISFTPTGGGFGITTVRFENLNQQIRKKYGYDFKQAAAFDIAQREANVNLKFQMISNLEAAQLKRIMAEAARQAELQREQAEAAQAAQADAAQREAAAQEALAQAAMIAATNPPAPQPTIIIQQQQQQNVQQNFIH